MWCGAHRKKALFYCCCFFGRCNHFWPTFTVFAVYLFGRFLDVFSYFFPCWRFGLKVFFPFDSIADPMQRYQESQLEEISTVGNPVANLHCHDYTINIILIVLQLVIISWLYCSYIVNLLIGICLWTTVETIIALLFNSFCHLFDALLRVMSYIPRIFANYQKIRKWLRRNVLRNATLFFITFSYLWHL